jgi:hypothetical protein
LEEMLLIKEPSPALKTNVSPGELY